MRYLIVFMLLPVYQIIAQSNDISAFEPLMQKTWKAEGAWGDGSKFKQESVFSYALDSTLVIVKSKGFTNKEQTTYGDRNHGIRKFDPETGTIKFWEFDVFGGLTKGTVFIDGKNIRYQYQYGDVTVTDAWEYVDKNTYTFKVGSYENGTWKQLYLETQFKAWSKD